jgi:hypothetical protein
LHLNIQELNWIELLLYSNVRMYHCLILVLPSIWATSRHCSMLITFTVESRLLNGFRISLNVGYLKHGSQKQSSRYFPLRYFNLRWISHLCAVWTFQVSNSCCEKFSCVLLATCGKFFPHLMQCTRLYVVISQKM